MNVVPPSLEANLSYGMNKNRGYLQNSDFLSRVELRKQYALTSPNFPNCWKSGFLWKGILERCYYCLCRTIMLSVQYPATMSNRYTDTSVCLYVYVCVLSEVITRSVIDPVIYHTMAYTSLPATLTVSTRVMCPAVLRK